MDEFDRILSAEPRLEPSAGFTAEVMRSVTLASTATPPPPFPWIQVLLGSAASGALALTGVLLSVDVDSGVWLQLAKELEPVLPYLGYTALTLTIVLGALRLQRELAIAD